MKLSQQSIDIINSTIIDELTARYIYEIAANWCRNYGYDNSEKYFKSEAVSEAGHYEKLIDFLADYAVTPTFPVITPVFSPMSLRDIFQEQYNIEADLLAKYENNARSAFAEDLNVFRFLQQFIEIQDESVREAKTFLDKISHYEKFDTELILFDEEVMSAD